MVVPGLSMAIIIHQAPHLQSVLSFTNYVCFSSCAHSFDLRTRQFYQHLPITYPQTHINSPSVCFSFQKTPPHNGIGVSCPLYPLHLAQAEQHHLSMTSQRPDPIVFESLFFLQARLSKTCLQTRLVSSQKFLLAAGKIILYSKSQKMPKRARKADYKMFSV